MDRSTETFVTPAWLADHLHDPSVVPVEASFYLPDEGMDADALFNEAHIPGAVRFDVDNVADHSSDLPHMLPDAATFGRMVGALGISETDIVVIYDATDLLGGARAWWMFRHYGAANNVRILEGGLSAWRASNLPVEQGPARRPGQTFRATFDGQGVVNASQVLAASETKSSQIVDARSAPRFAGTVPEPRAGLRSGHIPSSRNLPWRHLIDANGRLRGPDEIAAAFREAGIDIERPVITSCGSGVSAAILLLGLEQLGQNGLLYDGSWSEWGMRANLPVETGPAQA